MAKSEKVCSIHKIAADSTPCIAICAGKRCAKVGSKQLVPTGQQALAKEDLRAAYKKAGLIKNGSLQGYAKNHLLC
jgi:hypothetical protein